jgi:hypothetical protein
MMKLTRQQAIKNLQALADRWPAGISLLSANGTLMVIDDKNGRVLDCIHGIPNDGGDPDFDERADGETYVYHVSP